MVKRNNKLKTAQALFKVLHAAMEEYVRQDISTDEAIEAALDDMTDYLAAFKLVKRKHDRLRGSKKLNTAHLKAH